MRTNTIYLLAKSVIVLVILFSDPDKEFNYEIVLNYFGMFTFFLSRIWPSKASRARNYHFIASSQIWTKRQQTCWAINVAAFHFHLKRFLCWWDVGCGVGLWKELGQGFVSVWCGYILRKSCNCWMELNWICYRSERVEGWGSTGETGDMCLTCCGTCI